MHLQHFFETFYGFNWVMLLLLLYFGSLDKNENARENALN